MPSSPPRRILVSGGTGLLGSEFLRRALQRDPRCTVLLPVRPPKEGIPGAAGALSRWEALCAELGLTAQQRERVTAFPADFRAERLGLDARRWEELSEGLTDAVHCAAEVRFDQSLSQARASNVETTERMLALTPRGATFHHVSTFAVCRPLPGERLALERPVDLSVPFRNLYERTKAEAEQAVLAAVAGGRTARIYRTSILAGDSRTGWTSKFDGIYALARLFMTGAELGVGSFPVPSEARLEVLTLDSVAEALAALVLSDAVRTPGEVLHLTGGRSTVRLRDASPALVRALERRLLEDEGLQLILPSFEDGGDLTLSDAVRLFEQRIPPEALDTARPMLQPLLPYALDTAQYDNSAALERLRPHGVLLIRADQCADSLAGFCLRTDWGRTPERRPPATARLEERREPDPVVVVGLGAVLPGAPSVPAFLDRVEQGTTALVPVPADRWDASIFGARPGETSLERTCCTLGGFVEALRFEPRDFRVTPVTAASMDRFQKMALLCAREALAPLGLERREVDRSRVACILGHGGLYLENTHRFGKRLVHALFSRELEDAFGVRAQAPEVKAALAAALLGDTPPIGEDTLAGSLANVAPGRVMNAFDLQGPNWAVCAGNGSGLAALEQAVDLLRLGEADLVLAGAGTAVMDPLLYLHKGARGDLSPDVPRPFAPDACGTVPGEGMVMLAVCRLSFARARGLEPLAAVRGVGRAASGRTAPGGETSVEALRAARAVAVDQAGEALDGLELHGSGIPREDTLERAMLESEFPLGTPRLATSTQQFGSLFGASGAVGLLRAVLAVHHGRWLGGAVSPGSTPGALPRRVGVDAFGEGGPAFHAVIGALTDAERHGPPPAPEPPPASVPVAVVSLGAFLPGAPDIHAARALLASGAPQDRELPASAWDGRKESYVSADRDAPDRAYGTRGVLAGELPRALAPWLERIGLPPAVAAYLDDNHLHLLEAVRQVWADPSWSKPARPSAMGLVLGESTSSMRGAFRLLKRVSFSEFAFALQSVRETLAPGADAQAWGERLAELKSRLLADVPPLDEDSGPGILVPMTGAQVARHADARGTLLSVDAACASSLAAVMTAVRELRLRKLDAVAGAGVGLTVGLVANVLFSRCQALSARWSRPFDASADGILLGEGAVAFALKRLDDALRDGDTVHAVIEGVGASSDGRGTAIMAPSAEGQGRAVRRALADAGVEPGAVDFVECHATGTPVGDVAEVQSVAEGYASSARGTPLLIGSSKSVWGHTVGAAGAVGLLKLATAFRTGMVPPTPLPTGESPHLELRARNLEVPTAPRPWRGTSTRPRRAGLSSFGFGGTNWHLLLREPPELPAEGWCFVFPGHGSPYPGMGRVLYAQSAAFRAAIAEANDTLVALLGRTWEQLVLEGSEEAQQRALLATESVQPIILATNVAFYRAARALGLRPRWVMGHSVGEFSAAVVAGMLPLEDGLRLCHARGFLYRQLRDAGVDTGAMAAVLAPPVEVQRALEGLPREVGIATVNSRGQAVVSGPTPQVATAVDALAERGLTALPLAVEVAWHSQLAHGQGADGFRLALAGVAFQLPRLPLVRCARAQVLEAGAALPADYREGFVSQLRDAVDFPEMVEAAWALGARRFLEVGPRANLTGFIRDILAGRRFDAVAADVPKRPGFEGLSRAAALEKVHHG
jgi:acyl transferase domain-containing protein/thioester reductase-like protein